MAAALALALDYLPLSEAVATPAQRRLLSLPPRCDDVPCTVTAMDGLKLGPQQEPRQWCCTLDMPWRPLHFLVNRNHANRFALLALLWPTRPTTQRQRQSERWIVRWCGVELPTCQPDSSSSGFIGLPQCLDYSHYLIRFESSHGRRPTGGQVQNGATARMVEVWLPVPTNCRQRVKREEASAKSCGNYIGHSARLAAWLAKWICY